MKSEIVIGVNSTFVILYEQTSFIIAHTQSKQPLVHQNYIVAHKRWGILSSGSRPPIVLGRCRSRSWNSCHCFSQCLLTGTALKLRQANKRATAKQTNDSNNDNNNSIWIVLGMGMPFGSWCLRVACKYAMKNIVIINYATQQKAATECLRGAQQLTA